LSETRYLDVGRKDPEHVNVFPTLAGMIAGSI